MSKEIYVDGNGNENLVSGTINTADMLPIESGSSTNTKDYIDTGLSGKADTSSLSARVTDISNKFVKNTSIANFNFYCVAYYDDNIKRVFGSISCYTTGTGFSTTTPICTIDSDYRPSAEVGWCGTVRDITNDDYFYYGSIKTNGQVLQSLSSGCKGLTFSFEYSIL